MTTPNSGGGRADEWLDAPATTGVGSASERDLIARIASGLPAPPSWLLVGIGDDAAIVEPARNRVEALTVDALVDGVHFDRRFVPPEAIGHRALAVNLSDLAAMGAEPRLALISMALPIDLPLDHFDRIAAGLRRTAERYGVHIAGGNLTRTPGPLTIDITVTGTAKRRQILQRGTARAGDVVYVSGTLGSAAAGLQALRAGTETSVGEPCIERYRCPEPRLKLGLLLGRNRAATACMDLSDGLADGIRQIADASGVGLAIDTDAIPIDPSARAWFEARGCDPVSEALTGGDDYELLFTVNPKSRGRLQAAYRHGGVPLTRIGVCTADPRLVLHRNDGDVPMPASDGGFRHFR